MTKKLTTETADVVLALRALVFAVCQARADGVVLLETLSRGGLCVVLDEALGTIAIGIRDADSTTWLESVRCNPNDESTFGALLAGAAPSAVTMEANSDHGQNLKVH